MGNFPFGISLWRGCWAKDVISFRTLVWMRKRLRFRMLVWMLACNSRQIWEYNCCLFHFKEHVLTAETPRLWWNNLTAIMRWVMWSRYEIPSWAGCVLCHVRCWVFPWSLLWSTSSSQPWTLCVKCYNIIWSRLYNLQDTKYIMERGGETHLGEISKYLPLAMNAHNSGLIFI